MSKSATISAAVLYGDSGDPNYPWRYPLPNGWRKVRLGDSIDIVRGISFPKDAKVHEPRKGYVACLRTTNIQREVEWEDLWFVPEQHVRREDQYVRQGDILISTANSYELVGKVAPVTSMPYPATLGAFISLLRPKDDVDSKFAYYQIAWSDTQDRIRSTASTTTNISNVSTKKLSNIELAIPYLDEQKRIVEEIEKQFSRLDEAVANLKRVKANLKRYKAAILKAAVEGRLVETEAELARREGRSYETGEQLLQRILKTRRSQWKGKGKYKEPALSDTTNLPLLPRGWTWASLDQLLEFLRNGISVKPDRASGLPILRISAVRALSLNLEDVRYLSANVSAYENYALVAGDLLFTRYNGNPDLVGVCGVVPTLTSPLVHPDKLIRCKLVTPGALPNFVAIMANSGVSRTYLARRVRTTAGQAGISGGDLKGQPIPVPPLAEQTRVVAEVERRLSVIHELEAAVDANLQRAAGLRQSILRRAFSWL